MYMIRLLLILVLLSITMSCERHPDVSGRVRVNYTFNNQEVIGDEQTDFAQVVDYDTYREVYLYSQDTTSWYRTNMKLTIAKRGSGTYEFMGTLEDTPVYMFVTTPDSSSMLQEYYAPYNNTAVGEVELDINNSNHIRGSFNVVLKNTTVATPDVQITNGYFDIRY